MDKILSSDRSFIDPETYVFNFGSHNGETFDDVLSSDPEYILWCHDNVDWFVLDEDTLILVENSESDWDDSTW